MSEAIRSYDARPAASRAAWLGYVRQATWKQGLIAAVTWAAAALATVALPDVVPWGSAALFAKITAGAAIAFVALAFVVHRVATGSHGQNASGKAADIVCTCRSGPQERVNSTI